MILVAYQLGRGGGGTLRCELLKVDWSTVYRVTKQNATLSITNFKEVRD